MNTIKIILLIAISVVFLESCSTMSSPDNYYYITKKTSMDEFQKKHDRLIKDKSTVTVSGIDYQLCYVQMLTYMESSSSTSSTAGSSFGSSREYTQTSTKSVADFYIFVFKDNIYYYSGYIYELLRSSDENLKNIGIEAYSKKIEGEIE